MHVGVLGPLFVRVDGRDVTPRGQRLRDLLVVLLQRRGRPVPAEQLLDLVWGEQAAELDVSAVHTVVARLRRQLGPGTITSHGGGYLIDGDTTTDEETFSELVSRGREQLRRGEPSAAVRRSPCRAGAVARAGGFRGHPRRAGRGRPGRLAELRAAAIEELAATLLAHPVAGRTGRGQHADGRADFGPATARASLPAGHARGLPEPSAVRRAADLQDLRRLLRTELGIEPTPATANLHAWCCGRTEPQLRCRPSRADRCGRPSRLPAPVSPLIGRESNAAIRPRWPGVGG